VSKRADCDLLYLVNNLSVRDISDVELLRYALKRRRHLKNNDVARPANTHADQTTNTHTKHSVKNDLLTSFQVTFHYLV